ncbi:hypothetical protein P8452_07052 [Trifolium repens]|nr:hypothetical protein P8452_07052 [Trifolium repens]
MEVKVAANSKMQKCNMRLLEHYQKHRAATNNTRTIKFLIPKPQSKVKTIFIYGDNVVFLFKVKVAT